MLTTSIAKTFSDDHQPAVEDRRQLQLYDQDGNQLHAEEPKVLRYNQLPLSTGQVRCSHWAAFEPSGEGASDEKLEDRWGCLHNDKIDIYELRHDEAVDCTSMDITATDNVPRILPLCETLTSPANVSCAKRHRTY